MVKRLSVPLGLPALGALALGVCLVAPLAGSADAERTHDTDLQSALGSGDTLEVRNISGSITASQAAGGTASIHAHAKSRNADPASVSIRLVRDGNRTIVCAVYPGGSCDTHESHSSGAGHDRDDVSVDFTIAIPHGVKLVADTVDGNVVARQLDAAVTAHAVSGNITIGTADAAQAHTVSGSIDATFGRVASEDDLTFETVSGSIHVTLPANANATLNARTVTGPIEGDHGVPLSVDKGSWIGESGTAKFGSGSARISLHSVSGSIRVSQD